jgi:hypothetical protein
VGARHRLEQLGLQPVAAVTLTLTLIAPCDRQPPPRLGKLGLHPGELGLRRAGAGERTLCG